MGVWILLGLELVFVAAVVYGVWMLSHPLAFVVGGILGVIIVERVPVMLAPEPRQAKK